MAATALKHMYRVDSPNRADRAILELASALHSSESTSSVVSWSAQQRAHTYYEKRGLEATIRAARELRRERKKYGVLGNPIDAPSYIHQHPYLTFFGFVAVLSTIATVFGPRNS